MKGFENKEMGFYSKYRGGKTLKRTRPNQSISTQEFSVGVEPPLTKLVTKPTFTWDVAFFFIASSFCGFVFFRLNKNKIFLVVRKELTTLEAISIVRNFNEEQIISFFKKEEISQEETEFFLKTYLKLDASEVKNFVTRFFVGDFIVQGDRILRQTKEISKEEAETLLTVCLDFSISRAERFLNQPP